MLWLYESWGGRVLKKSIYFQEDIDSVSDRILSDYKVKDSIENDKYYSNYIVVGIAPHIDLNFENDEGQPALIIAIPMHLVDGLYRASTMLNAPDYSRQALSKFITLMIERSGKKVVRKTFTKV